MFGLLNVTRAVLPYLRAAPGPGGVEEGDEKVIANISSVGAWRGGAGAGLYAASKWAVSGLSESLSHELAGLGVKVVAVEPGYFRSNFLGGNATKKAAGKIEDYYFEGGAVRTTEQALVAYNGKQPGDVEKGARVMIDVLTRSGVAEGRDIPIRLVLGTDGYNIITGKCRETIDLLHEWKEISCSTDHDDVRH